MANKIAVGNRERGREGKATRQVQFDKQDCLACAIRPQCAHSQENPRQLTLPLQAQYLAKTESFPPASRDKGV
ncbi:MAG: transposase [bacterium]|nr:transposase [bacterium]